MKTRLKTKNRLWTSLSPDQTNFSIDNSANAKKASNRFSKGHANSLQNSVETETAPFNDDFPKADNDKSLEEIDVLPQQQVCTESCLNTHGCYSTYPLDLWFILSEYITPELVGKFALICKSSYFVTTSVAFYKQLWARHDPVFQPAPCTEVQRNISFNVKRFINKANGRQLRPNVIRGLYCCYPPFKTRLKLDPYNEDLEKLYGWKCLVQWHNSAGAGYSKRYVFNFKLKEGDFCNSKQAKHNDKKAKKLCTTEEEECCVLQITCKEFVDFYRTQVSGLLLTKAHFNVSSDMMSRKIKLVFHKPAHKLALKHYRHDMGDVVILCSVLSHQIIRWWDPLYPFKNIQF
uniref:Hemicentin-1 n=1 Tax=Phallusia mammillata TaxID=59560 RepID=A0A6F9DEI2_9ASCI|nr:hemicentin-1 [Phallusia mammillata]